MQPKIVATLSNAMLMQCLIKFSKSYNNTIIILTKVAICQTWPTKILTKCIQRCINDTRLLKPLELITYTSILNFEVVIGIK